MLPVSRQQEENLRRQKMLPEAIRANTPSSASTPLTESKSEPPGTFAVGTGNAGLPVSPVKSKSKQKRAEKEPNPIDLAIQQFGPGLSFDRNLPDESVPGPGANTAYSALQSRGGTASLETYQQAVEASTSCTSPTVLKDDNGRPPLPGVLAYLLARPRAFVPTVDVHHTSGPGVDGFAPSS